MAWDPFTQWAAYPFCWSKGTSQSGSGLAGKVAFPFSNTATRFLREAGERLPPSPKRLWRDKGCYGLECCKLLTDNELRLFNGTKSEKFHGFFAGRIFLRKLKHCSLKAFYTRLNLPKITLELGRVHSILEGIYLPMTVPHIPALRRGRPYESLDQSTVLDYRNGTALATISQVNAGIVRKDLAGIAQSRAALKKLTAAELIEICARAGRLFLDGTLPLGDKGAGQSAVQYIETLSATSGLPHVMVRRNMAKIHDALTQMKTILDGLTRGLDLSILDTGFGRTIELLSGGQQPGPGHAQQFTGGQFAVAGGHSAENPGRHQTRPRRTLDAVSFDPGLHRGGLSGGGVWLLSDRSRRRGRDFALLRPFAAVWRQEHDRPLCEQSRHSNSRPGLQQNPGRRGRNRALAGIYRLDGLRDFRQWRPQLHQRLGHCRAQICRRNCRRPGPEAWPDCSAAGGG